MIKLFKGKNEVKIEEVKKDENGNFVPVNKNNGKFKKVVKKVALVVTGLAAGAAAFCLVGVAMAAASDGDSSNTIDVGDGTITFTPNEEDSTESTETESTETSEE